MMSNLSNENGAGTASPTRKLDPGKLEQLTRYFAKNNKLIDSPGANLSEKYSEKLSLFLEMLF